jgi:hypothetical protein
MTKPGPWVDRRNRIVIRGRRAIALSMLEFAIFDSLHTSRTRSGPYKVRMARELVDQVYTGIGDPPLCAQQTAYQTARKLNGKLAHIGMTVRAINRRHNSFYRLQDI